MVGEQFFFIVGWRNMIARHWHRTTRSSNINFEEYQYFQKFESLLLGGSLLDHKQCCCIFNFNFQWQRNSNVWTAWCVIRSKDISNTCPMNQTLFTLSRCLFIDFTYNVQFTLFFHKNLEGYVGFTQCFPPKSEIYVLNNPSQDFLTLFEFVFGKGT